jgi:hypothetical protein
MTKRYTNGHQETVQYFPAFSANSEHFLEASHIFDKFKHDMLEWSKKHKDNLVAFSCDAIWDEDICINSNHRKRVLNYAGRA